MKTLNELAVLLAIYLVGFATALLLVASVFQRKDAALERSMVDLSRTRGELIGCRRKADLMEECRRANQSCAAAFELVVNTEGGCKRFLAIAGAP